MDEAELEGEPADLVAPTDDFGVEDLGRWGRLGVVFRHGRVVLPPAVTRRSSAKRTEGCHTKPPGTMQATAARIARILASSLLLGAAAGFSPAHFGAPRCTGARAIRARPVMQEMGQVRACSLP